MKEWDIGEKGWEVEGGRWKVGEKGTGYVREGG